MEEHSRIARVRQPNVLSLSRRVPSGAGRTDRLVYEARGAEAPGQRTARGRLLRRVGPLGDSFYAGQLREVTLSIVMNETKDLAGLVNASGFALQLAIAKAVEDSSSQHRFELEAHEHPWKTTEDRGFIDLIFGRSNVQ